MRGTGPGNLRKDRNVESKAKILAVDDSRANLAIIQEMLGDEHQLRMVESGAEALEIVREFQPDITILDVMMPGIDGYEVCRKMRADPSLNNNRIIMVSAKVLITDRLKGYAAGADDYITKPFNEKEVIAKIGVFLRLKNAGEVKQLKSGMMSVLGPEVNMRLSGILLPSSILMSDGDLESIERKMLAEMINRNVTSLQELLEEIVNLWSHAPELESNPVASGVGG